MTHHITYGEVRPLRQAAHARRYFIDHFDLFVQIAVRLHLTYEGWYDDTNSERYRKVRERLDVLAALLSTLNPKWVRAVEADGDSQLVEECSRIAAAILLGHASEFAGVSMENMTMQKHPPIKQFRDRVRLEFDL